MEKVNSTLGPTPSTADGDLFSKVKEACDRRLECYKVKIEEGVTANSDVVVLDPEIEVVTPVASNKRTLAQVSSSAPAAASNKKARISVGQATSALSGLHFKKITKPANDKDMFGDDDSDAGLDAAAKELELSMQQDAAADKDKGKGKETGRDETESSQPAAIIRPKEPLTALGMSYFSFTHTAV
jgi:hypothetical protein